MYCKNCGSILASNANFCHVCGAKVEIDDIFDTPKDEFKDEEKKLKEEFQDNSFKDEAKVDDNNLNQGTNFFYGYQMSDEEQKQLEQKVAAKKSFIPGLIGTIGSAIILFDAGATYGYNMLVFNYQYNNDIDSAYTYLSNVYELLTTVGVSLVLACILGGVLGSVGLYSSLKIKNKKGIVFSSIAIGLAVIALIGAIVAFIFRYIVGGKL